MPSAPINPDSWHLDKKVPISLIIVLVGQIVGFGMWMSQIESRIGQAIEINRDQSDELTRLRSDTQSMAVGAATVAAQLQALREGVLELKTTQRETNDLLRALTTQEAKP